MSKKNHSSNIFLFHGQDTYQSNQKIKFWQEEFDKKYGPGCLEIIEAKDLDKADFISNIQALPFLSEKRLIVVKDFLSSKNSEDQKIIAQNLDKINENCIIVFHENYTVEKNDHLYKKIHKLGKIQEFKGLSGQELANWIMEKAQNEEIKIDLSTAIYLSQNCGPDLWSINNELQKLKTFANGQTITKEMINELCSPSLSSSIFKLIDFIAEKNSKKSLQALTILEDSDEDLSKIFFMIVRHFRILIQVQELLKKGDNQISISKRLNQHPFVIQKSLQQCKNFSLPQIEKIYQKLLEIDIKSKSGIIKTYKTNNREFKLTIEHLIIDCCQNY